MTDRLRDRHLFRFEHYELRTSSFELLDDGEQVRVEPQVFDVLAYLIENRDRVVSKEELLDNVWGDRFVSESALTTRIKMARRAVGDDGRAQRLIRNSHGRGYQFVGEVFELDDATEATVPTAPAVTVDHQVPTGQFDFGLLVDEEFGFVGRTELLAQAAAQVDRIIAGGSGAILIGGEPGIGKTRLAAEIARHAQATHGMQALAGRCDRHLASSLQPWLEALGGYVNTVPAETLEADSAGIADHLRSVFPTLQVRLPPTDDTPTTAGDQYALLDALVVLLERISARTPLLIVLDDIQWAGGATRALASLLLRRGLARVLLVVTVRTTIDDLDEVTRDWLSEISVYGTVDRFELTALEEDDLKTLLADLDVPNSVRDQIAELSGGHSLFATELLRDVRRGAALPHLPDTVATLIRSRLDHLPDEVSLLVGAAAAIGPDFELRVAGEAAGLDALAALEAVETALDAELVHEVEGSADRFRFSHQLVPSAVLESMSGARLVRLHARIAEVIESHGGPGLAVAHHLLEAFPVLNSEDVLNSVRSTADAAVAEHQYDAAAELLRRCAQLSIGARERAEMLISLGRALNMAGRQPEALEPFEHATKSARQNGWPDILVAAAVGRWGNSPFRASQDRTVIPLIDEALGVADQVEPARKARLLAKRAAFTLFTGDLAERDEESAKAVELVGDDVSIDRLAVLEARWMAIACPKTVFDIVPLDDELAVLRKELGVLVTDACAPEIGLYWRGDGEALWQLADEVEADPRQRRDVDQWRTTTLTATDALFNGRFDEARNLTDAALPLGRQPWGESGQVVHALVHLVINVLDGVPEDSLARWDEIVSSVPSDNMIATRAWAEAVGGNADTAGELIDSVTGRFDLMADNFMGGFGLVGAAEAVLALNRDDLVEPLRDVLTPLSDRMLGHPWAPSFAAGDVLCRLDLLAGDQKVAARHRDQALDLYSRLGATTFADRLSNLIN